MKTQVERTIEGYENAEIMQDEENYYIDLRLGLSEAIYPKNLFTLDEAIDEAINWKME